MPTTRYSRPVPNVILLRHGQSQWNLENRFTGWMDVPLSPRGETEARAAGAKLRHQQIDRLYTSMLSRAIETARIALEAAGTAPVPLESDVALNERHYGDLEGLAKTEARRRFGPERLMHWRRSYHGRPPGGESLADTLARVLPYWTNHMLVDLRAELNVLVVAHSSSLRALVMCLERLAPARVIDVKIPTAVPLLYEMTRAGTVTAKRYL